MIPIDPPGMDYIVLFFVPKVTGFAYEVVLVTTILELSPVRFFPEKRAKLFGLISPRDPQGIMGDC